MAQTDTPRESLGVGSLIGETFSIFFRRIVHFVILGSVILAITTTLSGLLFGFDTVFGLSADESDPFANPVVANPGAFLATILIGMLGFGFMTACFMLMAYDAKLGRPARIGGYVMVAARFVLPIAILTLAVSILIGLGAVLFVIPGLWVMAVFSVVVPCIVIEGAGFGAMGRSSELTKGYRWPIVGLYIVCVLLFIVVAAVVGGVVGAVSFATIPAGTVAGAGSILTLVIVQSLGNAIAYGFMSVAAAVVYARLREIKDGVAVSSLVEVFS
ncbi:MAG: hypothetical protein AAGK37_18495 [Pseudomonadota bacterium]